MPTRVLHLIHWLNPGGIERWLIQMINAIPRSELEMDVCCKGPSTGILTNEIASSGAEIIQCQLSRPFVGFVPALAKVLKQGKYDVLHAHVTSHMGLAVAAARQAGIPVIATAHNESVGTDRRWTQNPVGHFLSRMYINANIWYSLRNATIVAPVSEAVLKGLYGAEAMDRENVQVFYLGCAEPRVFTEQEKAQCRMELGLEPMDKVIVHVGSFTDRKNHRAVIAVFEQVSKQLENARLLLVGDGELRTQIEGLVSSKQLGSRVQFLGLRNDVPRIMQSSNALLLPSKREGLPIVIMEAEAGRLPIVASDIPSNREALGSEQAGRLVSVNDIEGLSSALLDVLSNESMRLALVNNARQRYESLFSPAATIQRLHELYAKSIS